MPIDPYIADRLHLLRDVTPDQFGDPEVMARYKDFHRDPTAWEPPPVQVEDVVIDGPHGDLRLRCYHPASAATSSLLWVHGGGFLSGDLQMPESHVVAAELAARAGAAVVSVDYRLAVDGVRHPVPGDDVQAAWEWLTNAALADGPQAVGGASAGAALALGCALHGRDTSTRVPDLLLLAYPFAHFPVPALDDLTAAQMADLPPVLRFPPAAIEYMVRNYVGRITDLPRDALPGGAKLVGLPPTAVVVCEYDDLRGSAELLERQLRESGVQVHAHLAVGMLHGHLNRTPGLAEVDRTLDFLAERLHPTSTRVGPSTPEDR